MNLTPEREAHLRHLAGTDNAMRDAMGMLDRARSERVMYARALLRLLEATGAALDLDAQAVARADEPHGLEPRAAADASQRHDAGSGLGDLTAGRADVGDGLDGGGHGEDGSTVVRGCSSCPLSYLDDGCIPSCVLDETIHTGSMPAKYVQYGLRDDAPNECPLRKRSLSVRLAEGS